MIYHFTWQWARKIYGVLENTAHVSERLVFRRKFLSLSVIGNGPRNPSSYNEMVYNSGYLSNPTKQSRSETPNESLATDPKKNDLFQFTCVRHQNPAQPPYLLQRPASADRRSREYLSS